MSQPSPHLVVAGLGPAGLDLLPARTLDRLRTAPRLLVRTDRHPAVTELRELGLHVESLDWVYESCRDFSGLYPSLADAVIQANRQGPLIYAVPGNPVLGEESVRLVLESAGSLGWSAEVLPAPGFLDVIGPALVRTGTPVNLVEWQVADAAGLERCWWDTARPVIIFQIDDGAAASRTKAVLQAEYPDDFLVTLIRGAGDPDRESVTVLPLYQLDRPEAGSHDHLTSLYVPELPDGRRRRNFADLVEVMARLRGPGGCPWDREQTYVSLKRFVLEEAYEVLEAVDAEDPDELCGELGDLLLQVVFYARLAEDDGDFDIRDVCTGIVEKLIRRHPHVFGDLSVEDADEVLRNWDAIKRQEKPARTGVLDGVPGQLPALMKAAEISKRVVKVGFEWPTLEDVLAKLDEEVAELKTELRADTIDRDRAAGELGDLLFTVVNVARKLKIDPEEALRTMLTRFSARFGEVERLAYAGGKPLADMSLPELDQLWDQAKVTVG